MASHEVEGVSAGGTEVFFEAGLVDEGHVGLEDVFCWLAAEGVDEEGVDEEGDHAFGDERV